MHSSLRILTAGFVLGSAPAAHAVSILSPSDQIFGIDLDTDGTIGPDEGADKSNDGNVNTKYLNFGREYSGVMYLFGPSSSLQSMVLTTANDSPERNPTSYLIFGTNKQVILETGASVVNDGWTLVSSGTLALSTSPLQSTTVNLTTRTSATFSSYWVVFPTISDSPVVANSMQIAEIGLYTGANGTGTRFTTNGNAFSTSATGWQGSSPSNETAGNLLDGNPATKYLNFGGTNSGFVVYPAVGATIPSSFTITSAADAAERDPANYTFYGLTASGVWSIISSGSLTSAQMPAGRVTAGQAVPVSTTDAYVAYGFVANTLRGPSPTAFQIGDFQVDGVIVPEASPALLSLSAAAVCLVRRRRKA